MKVNATSSGFTGSNVHVGKSNGIVRDETFVLTFQGLKVQERMCRDGVWRIERCPPSSNTHCSAIQIVSMKHCNTKIIARKIVHGIHIPCYDGLWSYLKGFAPIHHKFWFCAYDLTCYVGRTGRKYCVDRPFVPSTWPMRVRTDLTQFEVTTLKEVGFVLCEVWKCALRTFFANESTTLCNQHANPEARPKTHNNKFIQ
jgi:hypothetical protein